MGIWLKGNNLHYHCINPRPPLVISPYCAAFCRERGIPLPELPSPGLIAIRANCARLPTCLVLQNPLTEFFKMMKVFHAFGGWSSHLASQHTLSPLMRSPSVQKFFEGKLLHRSHFFAQHCSDINSYVSLHPSALDWPNGTRLNYKT